MLKVDAHKRAMERLENLIDPDHIKRCDAIQTDAWMGRTPEHLPTIVCFPTPEDWPTYQFLEAWDDLEKNFMNSLSMVYITALLKDDKTCAIAPDFGVVNIPEVFGVPSVLTNEGHSMSKGLNDVDKIRELISRGVPEMSGPSIEKTNDFYDFASEVLKAYDKLSQVVHFIVPDNQGPFDLAHLIWGHQIMYATYDYPDVVRELVELTTQTYIEFTSYYKKRLNQSFTDGYHCCGVKLVRGGVRVCDDSAVLCSRDNYLEYCKPYNARAYEPYKGGWLHYCGNGNHFLDDLLTTPGINAVHMGNPDNCDLFELHQKAMETDTTIIWSGSLDRLAELRERNGGKHLTHLIVLTENRYASIDLDDAKADMERIRNYQPIPKAPY